MPHQLINSADPECSPCREDCQQCCAEEKLKMSETQDKCPACWSTVPEIRFELKMHGTVAPEHWMQCFHPWHEASPPSSPTKIPNFVEPGKVCRNPNHMRTDGSYYLHEIGPSCMAEASPPSSPIPIEQKLRIIADFMIGYQISDEDGTNPLTPHMKSFNEGISTAVSQLFDKEENTEIVALLDGVASPPSMELSAEPAPKE